MMRQRFAKSLQRMLLTATLGFIFVVVAGFDPFTVQDPDVHAGNDAFEQGKFDEALKRYDKALERLKRRGGKEWEEKRQVIFYNRGCALMQKGELERAGEELLKATTSKDKHLRRAAYYNLGNLAIMQVLKGKMTYKDALDKLDSAIEFYKRALLIDHTDRDAKYNLEIALLLKKQLEEQQKNQQQQNQNQSNQPNQQNQQNTQQENQANNQKEDQNNQQQQQAKNKQEQRQESKTQEQTQQQQAQQRNNQQQNAEQKQAEKQQQKDQKSEQAKQAQASKSEKTQGKKAQAKALKPIDQQKAEQLLDALRESEKPLKLFLFEMQQQGQGEESSAGKYKSW